jgi:hypothetical protein
MARAWTAIAYRSSNALIRPGLTDPQPLFALDAPKLVLVWFHLQFTLPPVADHSTTALATPANVPPRPAEPKCQRLALVCLHYRRRGHTVPGIPSTVDGPGRSLTAARRRNSAAPSPIPVRLMLETEDHMQNDQNTQAEWPPLDMRLSLPTKQTVPQPGRSGLARSLC